MKNFEEKEPLIQEICKKIRTASDLDIASRLAYYDIIKIVREAYYEGHDAGVKRLSEIYAKNQEIINNLFKF
jgi:hypothetical protein